MGELKDKLINLEGLQILYNIYSNAGKIPAFDGTNENMFLIIKDGVPQWDIISITNNPSKPSKPTYSITLLNLSDLDSMSVGDSKTIIMISPHATQGYVLGYNGSSVTGGEAHSYSGIEDINTAVENCKENNNYKFIITKNSTSFTIVSIEGNMSPNRNSGSVTWGSTPDVFTLSNPTSEMDNLASGISAVNNPNMIRFTNNGSYLNSGGAATALKYATGTGGWSAWYLYEVKENSGNNPSSPEEIIDEYYRFTGDMIKVHPQKTTYGSATWTYNEDTHDLAVTFDNYSEGILLYDSSTMITGSEITVFFDSIEFSSEISSTAKEYIGIYDNKVSSTQGYNNTSGVVASWSGTNPGIQINTSSKYISTGGGSVPITITYKNFGYKVNGAGPQ